MLNALRTIYNDMRLAPGERTARQRDHGMALPDDPGIDAVVTACLGWIGRAQDMSASNDGGVARDYHVGKGWATSYPETTGYIVPTMLAAGEEARARRMLDWLCAIQLPDGGFQGGKIDARPVQSVTFNTGQILIGLAAAASTLGDAEYVDAMHRAARFLRDSLDADGCWRSHPSPFTHAGEKAYETHVAWGLFEAERAAPGEGYGDAGLRQVDWALGKMQANGWVDDCCLQHKDRPLTHTLGYYLRGVVEAHRLSDDQRYLDASHRMAVGLIGAVRRDGALPGRLRADWSAAAEWSCLTGNVQIAESLFYLAARGGDETYVRVGRGLNDFVRRTVALDGDPDVVGGVRGSFPIDGEYGRYAYLNWAAKFTIDSCRVEKALTEK
jgi:hypothetical protein